VLVGCDVDLRELKALELAARAKIVCTNGVWSVPSQTNATIKYRVTLKPEVSCTCEDFNLTGKPCKHVIAARLVREGDGIEDAPPIELPRLYVLSVGVAKYQDENLALNYAARDAQAVADAFKTHSKPLFRDIQVKVLTDRDATRAGIIKGLGWLRQEVTQKDVGVIFFSGHGDRDTDGNLFFLPVDADSKDVASSSVPAEQVKKTLLAMPGRVVLILDACHSGGVDRPKKKSARDLTDGLVRDLAAEESGLVVLCSSTGAEFSLENNEHRQGNFTLALVEALSGKAARTDGAVYLHQVDAYVTDRVKELTKGRQHPVTSKPSTIRSFPLTRP
jgi:uncharacterized caspase-like protein